MDHWARGYYPWHGVILWIAIVLIVAVSALRKYLTERERQQTLRAALERGQPIDPAVINKIVTRQAPYSSRRQLQTGGVITLSVGIGLGLMGLFVFPSRGPDFFNPLLGPGVLVAVIGLGILLASLLQPKDPDGSDPPDGGM